MNPCLEVLEVERRMEGQDIVYRLEKPLLHGHRLW